MAEHNTLKSLVLAMEYEAFRERAHQDGCRARRIGSACLTCHAHEVVWLAADRRLQNFLDAAAALEAAAKVADEENVYGLVDAF